MYFTGMFPPSLEAIRESSKLTQACRDEIEDFLNARKETRNSIQDMSEVPVDAVPTSVEPQTASTSRSSDEQDHHDIPCSECGYPDLNNPCVRFYENEKVS